MYRMSASACNSPTLMETLRSSKNRLIKSRNLINEYLLMKSSTPILNAPPPIFRSPVFYQKHYISSTPDSGPASILSSAYCGDELSCATSVTTCTTITTTTSTPLPATPHAIFETSTPFQHNSSVPSQSTGMGSERNKEIEIKYIDDNSIELLDKPVEPLIVPERRTPSAPIDTPARAHNKCRLVGKVNPNILKTWEQLNGIAERNGIRADDDNILQSLTSDNDKQSCVLYYRKANDLTGSVESNREIMPNKYPVNKILHSESSGDFFDSIDQSITENTSDYNDHDEDDVGLRSNYYQDERRTNIGKRFDDEEEDTAAGDGMADFDSVEKKKIFWSIDIN